LAPESQRGWQKSTKEQAKLTNKISAIARPLYYSREAFDDLVSMTPDRPIFYLRCAEPVRQTPMEGAIQ
jgi:hypothetical protein